MKNVSDAKNGVDSTLSYLSGKLKRTERNKEETYQNDLAPFEESIESIKSLIKSLEALKKKLGKRKFKRMLESDADRIAQIASFKSYFLFFSENGGVNPRISGSRISWQDLITAANALKEGKSHTLPVADISVLTEENEKKIERVSNMLFPDSEKTKEKQAFRGFMISDAAKKLLAHVCFTLDDLQLNYDELAIKLPKLHAALEIMCENPKLAENGPQYQQVMEPITYYNNVRSGTDANILSSERRKAQGEVDKQAHAKIVPLAMKYFSSEDSPKYGENDFDRFANDFQKALDAFKKEHSNLTEAPLRTSLRSLVTGADRLVKAALSSIDFSERTGVEGEIVTGMDKITPLSFVQQTPEEIRAGLYGNLHSKFLKTVQIQLQDTYMSWLPEENVKESKQVTFEKNLKALNQILHEVGMPEVRPEKIKDIFKNNKNKYTNVFCEQCLGVVLATDELQDDVIRELERKTAKLYREYRTEYEEAISVAPERKVTAGPPVDLTEAVTRRPKSSSSSNKRGALFIDPENPKYKGLLSQLKKHEGKGLSRSRPGAIKERNGPVTKTDGVENPIPDSRADFSRVLDELAHHQQQRNSSQEARTPKSSAQAEPRGRQPVARPRPSKHPVASPEGKQPKPRTPVARPRESVASPGGEQPKPRPRKLVATPRGESPVAKPRAGLVTGSKDRATSKLPEQHNPDSLIRELKQKILGMKGNKGGSNTP